MPCLFASALMPWFSRSSIHLKRTPEKTQPRAGALTHATSMEIKCPRRGANATLTTYQVCGSKGGGGGVMCMLSFSAHFRAMEKTRGSPEWASPLKPYPSKRTDPGRHWVSARHPDVVPVTATGAHTETYLETDGHWGLCWSCICLFDRTHPLSHSTCHSTPTRHPYPR